MTDHEKEILDKIKQSTEKTPVPESLAPDQIMKMLEEHNLICTVDVYDNEAYKTTLAGFLAANSLLDCFISKGNLLLPHWYWLSALAPTSASRIFLQTQPLFPQKAVLQSVHPPVSLLLPIL